MAQFIVLWYPMPSTVEFHYNHLEFNWWFVDQLGKCKGKKTRLKDTWQFDTVIDTGCQWLKFSSFSLHLLAFCLFLTTINNTVHIYIWSYRRNLKENICVRFVTLLCNPPPKREREKLENDVPKPYLKKSPFFAHAANSIRFKSAVMLNKVLLVGNSGTTWKINIHESKNHSQIAPLWLKTLLQCKRMKKC
jgi:hypothetical protein